MEGRYIRRFGRGSRSNQTLLPVRVTRLANMVSSWYCDLQTSFLNEPLFRFGRRYSRCLRVWVSVGLGFSLTALLGVILILLWDLGGAVHLYKGNDGLSSLLNGSLFGFSSSISGLIMSLPDIGYIFLASILSVFIHEVGHALAASSFVWFALVLFLLPSILDPFYIHGESPMVLYVSPISPLAGYVSPRDLIISLDGTRIHNVQEWKEKIALVNEQMLQNLGNSGDFNDSMEISGRTGYCVPDHLIRESIPPHLEGNYTTCPNELFSFAASPCLDSAMLDDVSIEDNHLRGRQHIHCLNPKDVVKLKNMCWNENP